jgi:hypothetical protein
MTVFASAGEARTMDYKTNEVGYVPAIAGHYLQSTGTDDLVFLSLFKTSEFEFSLDQYLRRLPVQITEQHLHLSPAAIAPDSGYEEQYFPDIACASASPSCIAIESASVRCRRRCLVNSPYSRRS